MSQLGAPAASGPGICPVCGTGLGGASVCPNCGYNPVSIAAGGPASVGSPTGAPRSFRFAILSAAFILLAGALGFYVARNNREALRWIGAPIGLDQAIGIDLSPSECRERVTHYLDGMFSALNGPGHAARTAQLQTEAGDEFGVTSREWRGLLDIYTSHSGVAATTGAKKALRQSRAEVTQLCGAGV